MKYIDSFYALLEGAKAQTSDFANDCHDEATGRFCDKPGHPTPSHLDRQIKDLETMIGEYEGKPGSDEVVGILKDNLKGLHEKRSSGAKPYHGVDLYGMPENEAQAVKNVMNTISAIHPISPDLTPVKIARDPQLSGGTLGVYKPAFNSIGLKSLNDQFSMIHELGHWQTINPNVTMDKTTNSAVQKHFLENVNALGLGNVYYHITSSKAIQRIGRRAYDGSPYASYLYTAHERYARAYAQYIATRSSSKLLKQQFNDFRDKTGDNDLQWSDEDFAPIAKAFDEHFAGVQASAAQDALVKEWGIQDLTGLGLFNSLLTSSRQAFSNPCHDENGRFCETPGSPGHEGHGRNIPVTPFDDEDKEFERVAQLENHYGRREMSPEMGGIQWAMEGGSPPITQAAQDILEGYPFDREDRFRAYDEDSYDAAETILKTIENESSDVTLYSGHKRGRDAVENMIEEGVFFPLVATSPDKALADQYAGNGGTLADSPVSVVFEFPPGTSSGFYQANEHIASGEFEVVSHKWNGDQTGIEIKLKQTKRPVVPTDLEGNNE